MEFFPLCPVGETVVLAGETHKLLAYVAALRLPLCHCTELDGLISVEACAVWRSSHCPTMNEGAALRFALAGPPPGWIRTMDPSGECT